MKGGVVTAVGGSYKHSTTSPAATTMRGVPGNATIINHDGEEPSGRLARWRVLVWSSSLPERDFLEQNRYAAHNAGVNYRCHRNHPPALIIAAGVLVVLGFNLTIGGVMMIALGGPVAPSLRNSGMWYVIGWRSGFCHRRLLLRFVFLQHATTIVGGHPAASWHAHAAKLPAAVSSAAACGQSSGLASSCILSIPRACYSCVPSQTHREAMVRAPAGLLPMRVLMQPLRARRVTYVPNQLMQIPQAAEPSDRDPSAPDTGGHMQPMQTSWQWDANRIS